MGMIDLINAVLKCLPWGEVSSRTAKDIADHLIANDVVTVVRCKDCIYYEETFGKDSGKPCGYGSCGCTSQIITGIIYDEDFCSYGERKDND